MKKHLLFGFLVLSISVLAQDVPTFSPTNYVDNTGKLYWNKNLPVYISLSPNPDGSDGTVLESEISAKYAEPFYFDTEGKNYMRTHWAVDKTTHKAVVPQQEILWEVYADGVAPVSSSSFKKNFSYTLNHEKIYDGSLSIDISSTDYVSRVKDIYYSLNGEPYRTYSGGLSNFKEGENILKYFAVDNVNNVETVVEKKFFIDNKSPETKLTVTGISLQGNVLSVTSKIYLEAKDDKAGIKKIFYQIDSSLKKVYTQGYNIPLTNLKDGDHVIRYYSIDNVGNEEEEQKFEFYLDRTAPITVSDILGDKFVVGDKVYFSGRTKMKITSIDNKSGVKQVLYSIDGGDFNDYTDPFYMPNEPGWHVVKYFALDSTENITKDQYTQQYYQYKMKVDKIFVDLSGPTMRHFISGDKFTRGDTTFIGPNSKINLSASDGESGLQMITYSIDGILKETPYIKPFSLDSFPTGIHSIEYFAYDNVNNRNIENFKVILDNLGPEIGCKFSVKPKSKNNALDVYPEGTLLFITVQDDLTGISNIYYSINNGVKYTYKNYVKGFVKGENKVMFEALDKLGNSSKYEVNFYIE